MSDKKSIRLEFDEKRKKTLRKMADNDKRSLKSYLEIVINNHVEQYAKHPTTKTK